MRIAILGGTGFLGSRVVQSLKQKHQLMLFHRGMTPLKLLPGCQEILAERSSLEQYVEQFRAFSPDIVLDIIAGSKAQALATMAAFKGIAQRIVAISSCDVYKAFDVFLGRAQENVQPVPLKETACLRKNLYLFKGSSMQLPPWLDAEYEKIHVEEVIMSDTDLMGTVLRLPMIYGPGDMQKRFQEIALWLRNGKEIILDQGAAKWEGCFGYIDNVIEAIRLSLENPKAAGQIYHLGECDRLTYKEIVQQFIEISGWPGTLEVSEKGKGKNLKDIFKVGTINPAQQLCLDSGKIRTELGYQEIVPQRDAFRQTYAWLS